MAAPSGPASSSPKRFLVLFDFDETIINESSDDAVVRAAPGQQLPDWLRASYREGRFTEHMQRVLTYMAEQGVTEDAIRSVVEKIPPTPGLRALFHYLLAHQHDYESVVISDANTYFIEAWLEHAGARQLFRRIFTNPAGFDAEGRLILRPFHSHSCPRCPENMCKQAILREYLARRQKEQGVAFQRVFYVGDGANDVCPSLALGPRDTAFPRRGFPMHRLLAQMQETQTAGVVKAGVVPWTDGEDVVECLKKLLEERELRVERNEC